MVRVILYNIEYCSGIQGSWWEYLKFWNLIFPPKYLDYVMANELKMYEPDVVGLLEVDTGSIRARKKDKTVFFREFLELNDQAERVKYTEQGISKIMKSMPITRKQANAILSKHELYDVRYHTLEGGTKKVAIDALIRYPKKFRILLVHLPLGRNARKRQLEQLIDIVNNIEEPLILMGDFNIFHGVKEIRPLLRKTKLLHYHGRKKRYTQPTNKPARTLDIILTSEEIEVEKYMILENIKYSDHLPVMIDFDIRHKSKKSDGG